MKYFYACVACLLLLSPSQKLLAQPFNHTPEWSPSATGLLPSLLNFTNPLQIDAAFGYKVTGLGDVNNDGFDDVAVSAPGMTNIITSSGSITDVGNVVKVGAVFLYFGTASGLPTTPDRVLFPSAPIANALFGISVAAGDVTGDGINDIVIGAPLDTIHTNLGSGNIQPTVGKIYIYQGGTGAFTSTVISPLLTAHLNAPEIGTANVNVNPLFGFSVAVTGDVNGDTKGDIVVGAPTYASVGDPTVKTGAAFVLLSNGSNTFSTVNTITAPTGSTLGLKPLVQGILGTTLYNTLNLLGALDDILTTPINGLLFGYSVDGAGDYNNDGTADVVVGAPGGVNLGLSFFSGLLSNMLAGTAHVYAGTGSGVNTTAFARLEANASLLGNIGNLFGYEVRGTRTIAGARDGGVIVGAPTGNVLTYALGGLRLKTGTVYVFNKNGASGGVATPFQTLSSPRNTSLLTQLASVNANVGALFGASIDNMRDVNNDGIADIIIGEPLSTNAAALSVNAAGGTAHIFLGTGGGQYETTPSWDMHPVVGNSLGVNAASLVGFSVAGGGLIRGTGTLPRPVIGAPGRSLDFSYGLLNLGNTVDTLTSFVAGNNGLGNAYTFNAGATILPVNLISFTGKKVTAGVQLQWTTASEINSKFFEVQRSADGASFVKIGQVGAAGNSSGSNIDYSFLDPAPLTGYNYYRLKMVDIDEAYEYSSTLLIRFDNTNSSSSVIVNPNPVIDKLQLSWKNMPAAEYTVDIINPGGEIVRTQKVTVNSFVQTTVIPRESNWGSGLFVVRIRSSKDQIAIKALLQ